MIFKCFWYNEDGYGPTDGISVMVQAEKETEAHTIAVDFINKKYPNCGKGYDFDQYEKYECTNLSNEKILVLNHISGGFPA